MNERFDPVVAEALAKIAPEVEADPDQLLSRARHAARPRRSWTLRAGALAFAGLLLAGGAALAATKLDLVPWLKTSSHTNVRYSVDPTKHYRGPAPAEVHCRAAGSGRLVCTASTAARGPHLAPPHTYELGERIEAQPNLTRKYVLHRLDAAEANGSVPPLLAQRIRLDAEAVPGDFFAKLNLLTSVRSIGTGPTYVEPSRGRAYVLVPPRNQAVIVACTSSTGATLRCRDLAAARGVPVGAPVYMLEASRDWPRAKRVPKSAFPAASGLFRHIFPRPLTPPERRLLFALETFGSGSGSTGARSGHATRVAPPAQHPPKH